MRTYDRDDHSDEACDWRERFSLEDEGESSVLCVSCNANLTMNSLICDECWEAGKTVKP